MKKGYYIHFDARKTPGVSKKIDMQMAEFSKYYQMKEINICAKDVSFGKRICRLLPGKSIDRLYEEAIMEIDDPVFIYVRRATADKQYRCFFNEIRRKWSTCKVIVEIFTYPYDRDEFLRLFSWPYYFKEKYNRPKLKNDIDRYVTFSQDEVLFHVPTIRTSNGILVDQVQVPEGEQIGANEIHLIAVAFMQKHHGYERVIKGLAAYYHQAECQKVILHLVGDGPEKKKYQKLVARFKLEDKVIFYPTTVGEELDKIYERGNIAVSSLGWYKDGLDRENTLKAKEYMAKGFPMITGCKVDGLYEEYPFICEFSNDATPIDIKRVVKFYNVLMDKYSKREMQQAIRDYIKKTADMPVVMQPIIEYIEKD